MKVLFIIGMVNGFTRPETRDGSCKMYIKGARDIIPAINKRIQSYRNDGETIRYIINEHTYHNDEFKFLPEHCISYDECQLDGEIDHATDACDVIVSDIDLWDYHAIEELVHGDTWDIELCGVCTELDIAQAAMGAVIRGHNVIIRKDCVTGLNRESSEAMLKILSDCYGVKIIDPYYEAQRPILSARSETWRTIIRDGEEEFICSHGIGHWSWPHSCDGCCRGDNYPGRKKDVK